jgi:hypothetical protein
VFWSICFPLIGVANVATGFWLTLFAVIKPGDRLKSSGDIAAA